MNVRHIERQVWNNTQLIDYNGTERQNNRLTETESERESNMGDYKIKMLGLFLLLLVNAGAY